MLDKKLKDEILFMAISELVNDSYFDDDDRVKAYTNLFDNIYSNNYRHEYSKITRVLFLVNDSDGRDFLIEKLNIIECILKNYDAKKGIQKLKDHIQLENIRMSELEKISQRAISASDNINLIKEEIESKVNEVAKNIKNSEEDLEKVQKDLKDSTTQSITILSIFAGVVMAFTGGMSYISQALASLKEIGPYRSGAFILLIGIIIFDVIFLLIYMIGKLTDRYIGSKRNCSNPELGCNKKTIWCSANRYQYVTFFNLIGFIAMITIINLYCIDRYDYLAKIYIYVFNDFKIVKLFTYSFFLLFLVPYVPFGFIMYKIKNNQCNCNQEVSKTNHN